LIKLVLDTNTIISGILWNGNEARIIEKAENEELQLIISSQLLEELEGVWQKQHD
jgi:putative PIN family toxin of toxin-antitoxin system